jgi:serine/threonine protein phosphatase PrpC
MLSDRGRLRHGNEDACGALAGAIVVCDGMGGAAGGEVASSLAVETFLSSLAGGSAGNGRGGRRAVDRHGADALDRVEKAVLAANHTVHQRAQRTKALRGMGTTLVGLMVEEAVGSGRAKNGRPTVCLAHVGDSRCYRLRGGALELLTEDHSLVEEQVRAGVLSRVQASVSPIRNIITRAIGAQAKVEPVIERLGTEPGDLYLLASDGLTRELGDGEIETILKRETGGGDMSEGRLGAACQALVDAANAHGGGDNITVALVWVG